MLTEPGIPPPRGAQHPDATAVREQLARILDDPGFVRSDRISELLCYLVERSLQEHSVQPKETVLGVEVFGRTPGYDTDCAGADALAHPAFSPDGHAIAFDWRGHRDAAEGIYVQRLDAERPARFSRSMA